MGNRHESLSTDMIAEIGRKSRLPKRSGGGKNNIVPGDRHEERVAFSSMRKRNMSLSTGNTQGKRSG